MSASRTILLLTGIGLWVGHLSAIQIPQPPPLLLTSQENGTDPQDNFSCSNVIYGYLTLPKEEVGQHIVEAIWIGPRGTIVQHSRDEVDFLLPGRRTASVWLKFPPDERSLWNPFSIQNPPDSNHLAYDGLWKVEVRWDNQVFTRSAFKVQCL